jgi:hypothetical protein
MRVTEQQIELAISLLKQALTLDEIEKQTGLNPSQINQIAHKHGLEKPWIIRKRIREETKMNAKIKRIPKNAERDMQIVELAKTGSTLHEIALQYGVSRERVRTVLIKNNAITPIEFRKQERAQNAESNNLKSQIVQNWVKTHMGCTIVELSLGTGLAQKECVQHLPKGTKHLILNPGEATNSNTWTTEKWTDNQILDGIRAAGVFASPLSYVSFDRIRKEHNIDAPSAIRILQRFGTWKNACEQAGVQTGQTMRSKYQRNWTEEEMIQWLATFMRQSTTSSYAAYNEWSKNQDGVPGGQTIRNLVGSWVECYELALLTLRKEWTD